MNTTERTFERVGVLSDLSGVSGKTIATDAINLMDNEKQVYLKVKTASGKIETAIVSMPLSKLLRTKQISLGTLLNYPLSKSSDGLYSIHNEERALVWHDTAKLTIKALVEVAITDDELIVL